MRLRRANFDGTKRLDDFEWKFNPKIPKAKIIDLATCHFVARHESVLLLGPTGHATYCTTSLCRGGKGDRGLSWIGRLGTAARANGGDGLAYGGEFEVRGLDHPWGQRNELAGGQDTRADEPAGHRGADVEPTACLFQGEPCPRGVQSLKGTKFMPPP
jgi:hypothetical protein